MRLAQYSNPMPKPESAPIVYRALVGLVRCFLPLVVTRQWHDLHRVPKQGGALVVSNHTSNFDTIMLGDALVAAGRWPRFLGKSEIWKVPVLGWLAVQCRQIPVERHTARAKDSLRHAAAALEQGDCVVIFPEGTITHDPRGWPMVARSGAARLALTTGAPVIPVAQEGCQEVLGGRYLRLRKLFSLRRRPIRLAVGEPVELTDLLSEAPSDDDIREASRRITEALTNVYASVRGEPAPELIWNSWKEEYVSRAE